MSRSVFFGLCLIYFVHFSFLKLGISVIRIDSEIIRCKAMKGVKSMLL